MLTLYTRPTRISSTSTPWKSITIMHCTRNSRIYTHLHTCWIICLWNYYLATALTIFNFIYCLSIYYNYYGFRRCFNYDRILYMTLRLDSETYKNKMHLATVRIIPKKKTTETIKVRVISELSFHKSDIMCF